MPLYCMKTQAAKHPWRCQRHCADVGQTFVAFLFQPFREKMLGAADVSWNQCIKSDALHHPKKTDKSWFPPMQWNKTCFFHLQSFSFFISFTPLSAILFTFLCWRTENQTWMKFTLMEFLGTDQLMKNSAVAVDGGPDPWGYANFRDSRDFSEGDRSVQTKSFYATKALGNKTFVDFWIVTIENVSLICWSNFRGFYCLKWVEAKRCIKCLGQ